MREASASRQGDKVAAPTPPRASPARNGFSTCTSGSRLVRCGRWAITGSSCARTSARRKAASSRRIGPARSRSAARTDPERSRSSVASSSPCPRVPAPAPAVFLLPFPFFRRLFFSRCGVTSGAGRRDAAARDRSGAPDPHRRAAPSLGATTATRMATRHTPHGIAQCHIVIRSPSPVPLSSFFHAPGCSSLVGVWFSVPCHSSHTITCRVPLTSSETQWYLYMNPCPQIVWRDDLEQKPIDHMQERCLEVEVRSIAEADPCRRA